MLKKATVILFTALLLFCGCASQQLSGEATPSHDSQPTTSGTGGGKALNSY